MLRVRAADLIPTSFPSVSSCIVCGLRDRDFLVELFVFRF